MFNSDLEDVLTKEKIRSLLDREVEEGENDLELYAVSDAFVGMGLTAEDLAAIDTAQKPVAQPVSTIQKRLIEATEKATSHPPYPWQIHVACSIHKKKPVVLVTAGTGYWKTLRFVVNSFRPNTIVQIVSPLSYIEMEQAKTFTDRGGLLARVRDGRGATPAAAAQHARVCGDGGGKQEGAGKSRTCRFPKVRFGANVGPAAGMRRMRQEHCCGMADGAAAIENCGREGEAGVMPGANAENAAGAGDLGADETVNNVREDAAANVDVDEEEVEGQEEEVEGVIECNDNAV
ncbi:hypothetical protein FRC12_023478 [Ceratobasidium sp. 428]|nr:hypothetical protein FRC12_023478 [Ceratobasidium sp. 428]